MNTQEGRDLTTGGVVLLMFVMALASLISIFMTVNTATYKYYNSQLAAQKTSKSETLKKLAAQDTVPISSVRKVLSLYTSEELFFVGILVRNEGPSSATIKTKDHIFTYETDPTILAQLPNIQDTEGNLIFTNSPIVDSPSSPSGSPTVTADGNYLANVNSLLNKYEDYECKVVYHLMTDNTDVDYTNPQDGTPPFVIITILNNRRTGVT